MQFIRTSVVNAREMTLGEAINLIGMKIAGEYTGRKNSLEGYLVDCDGRRSEWVSKDDFLKNHRQIELRGE